MEGVTGMMAWLGHVPGRCRGGVYGHADIDKPFFSYRVCTFSALRYFVLGTHRVYPTNRALPLTLFTYINY